MQTVFIAVDLVIESKIAPGIDQLVAGSTISDGVLQDLCDVDDVIEPYQFGHQTNVDFISISVPIAVEDNVIICSSITGKLDLIGAHYAKDTTQDIKRPVHQEIAHKSGIICCCSGATQTIGNEFVQDM